jgi:hypothetical protein
LAAKPNIHKIQAGYELRRREGADKASVRAFTDTYFNDNRSILHDSRPHRYCDESSQSGYSSSTLLCGYTAGLFVVIGTTIGLMVKYAFYKEYIFDFETLNFLHDTRTFGFTP